MICGGFESGTVRAELVEAFATRWMPIGVSRGCRRAGAPRQAACDAGSYCGGRCCASTPLRCSDAGRAAELATRSFGALRSNSCGKSVHEARVCPSAHARRPAPCASRRHRNRPRRRPPAAAGTVVLHPALQRPARSDSPPRRIAPASDPPHRQHTAVRTLFARQSERQGQQPALTRTGIVNRICAMPLPSGSLRSDAMPPPPSACSQTKLMAWMPGTS